VRVQVQKVTRLLGEDGTFRDLLHKEGVVFADKEPLEVGRHWESLLPSQRGGIVPT